MLDLSRRSTIEGLHHLRITRPNGSPPTSLFRKLLILALGFWAPQLQCTNSFFRAINAAFAVYRNIVIHKLLMTVTRISHIRGGRTGDHVTPVLPCTNEHSTVNLISMKIHIKIVLLGQGHGWWWDHEGFRYAGAVQLNKALNKASYPVKDS